MIIYKITNLINGKIYIGQTIRSLEIRWLEHSRPDLSDKNHMVVCKAIKKYGKENFKIEQIDNADTIEELNKKETEWIEKENSLVPNGYNLSGGGGNRKTHQSTKDKLSKAMKGRFVSAKHRQAIKDAHSIAVHQYTLEGKFIKSWVSSSEAARVMNIDHSSIVKCCKKYRSRRQMGGFQWTLELHEFIGPIRPIKNIGSTGQISNKRRSVAKIDVDGNIIQKYDSIQQAALENNCDISTVCQVCHGKFKKTKGLRFVFC